MAALYAAALGSVTAAVQSDEPHELPNLWISRGQLEDSPDEASVEHAFELERFKRLGDFPRLVPRIIGGQPAEPDAFSWQVDLGNCAGTLIAREWVLTAAHCVGGGMPDSVRVGSYERREGQEIEVSAIHIHPEYSKFLIHDIALLHLARAAPEALGVVALPDLATHNRLAAPGRTATAIGWGDAEPGFAPTHLQQADLLLEGCGQNYNYQVCTATLASATEPTNICFGDSGGPLLALDGGRYYQIGITSSTGGGKPGGQFACLSGGDFTKVASHLDWISSVTGTAFVEPPPVPEDPVAVDICSRTPAVLEEILSITGVADCATVTDADLAVITHMNFSNVGLTALQAGDLAGLSGLAFLNLRDNELTQLPAGLFANLAALAELVLDDNRLETLPADVFDPLAALTRLDLVGNSLRGLPEGVFDTLGSLAELNLGGNPIAALPEGIFADLTELRILSLGESFGSLMLAAGVFDGLEGLLWLTLRGVASLPADLFGGTGDLLELEVSNGALSSLPAGVFDNLSRLYKLNLNGNPLVAVPEGIFTNLTELGILFLGEGNGSLTLTAGVFDGLEGLLWLTLRGVGSLSADVFADTPNLLDLGIYDGALSSLPAGVFDNLSSLTDLYLAANPIAELPSGIFDELGKLTKLSLIANGIAEPPSGIFDNLGSLTELDLFGNRIAALPSGIFDELGKLGSFIELNLEGNPLTELPSGIFDNLSGLITLNISRNDIAELPSGIFDKLSGLVVLKFEGNPIAALPEGMFANLPGLVTIFLGDRTEPLTLTADVFDGLERLQRLRLYGVASLPADVFAAKPNLRELQVIEGTLSSLPAGVFEGLTNLRMLSLEDNELTTLPAGLFAGLTNLESLHLLGNPGTPFILIPKLESVGSGHQNGTVKLRVIVAEGAPFETSVNWTATGGVIGATTGRVSVPGGSLYSEPFSVTSADSRGQISIGVSDPTFLDFSDYSRQALKLAVGDPLMLDLATLPSIGEQFVVDEDIPGMPAGDWAPDGLSRAEFSSVNGQVAITFRHGGRIEEEGITYTCMRSGSCAIEGTRVTKGIILVSEPAEQADLMVAGVGELVDEKTVFQEKVYNGYELDDSTVTLRSVAGEITRVSFLDPGGDLIFVDFGSDDPTTEVVITLEEFAGALEESPYDQPGTRYAQGLATVTVANPTELTWLSPENSQKKLVRGC